MDHLEHERFEQALRSEIEATRREIEAAVRERDAARQETRDLELRHRELVRQIRETRDQIGQIDRQKQKFMKGRLEAARRLAEAAADASPKISF